MHDTPTGGHPLAIAMAVAAAVAPAHAHAGWPGGGGVRVAGVFIGFGKGGGIRGYDKGKWDEIWGRRDDFSLFDYIESQWSIRPSIVAVMVSKPR